MTALFHIDLKKVAHVIKRWRGQTKEALLLHRPRLGITLNDNEAAQHCAVFARNFLPRHFTSMLTARYPPLFYLWREKNAPPVFRHLHIVKLSPTTCLYPNGRTQIYISILKLLRD